MQATLKVLFRLLVKPFYKENAGAFAFVFVVMFCIIGKVDGAGVFEYHYSLMIGMLKNVSFLLLVFFAWLLYARKYTAFVSGVITKPESEFLLVTTCLSKTKQSFLLLLVEFALLMPVLLYAFFIICIGFEKHFYFPAFSIIGYLALLCFVPATLHVYLLNNPHKNVYFPWQKVKLASRFSATYPVILLRFAYNNLKLFWFGSKIFTCGILYLLARNNTTTDYDISFTFLFFNFGILANCVLIYRIRQFEERYLGFHRNLPTSVIKRFFQHSLVYFIFLVPEFITVAMLVPVHLHNIDAISFAFCAYSVLLLMNSVTFLQDFTMKEFVKILTLIFCVQYIFLLLIGLTWLYLFFFALALTFYFKDYYKYEQSF